ncbi:MAG: OmpA family protein [Myxococcota bacterium]|nr:OmpA family protein [Myxococcota bacterium]
MVFTGRLLAPLLLAVSLGILTGCPPKNPADTAAGAQVPETGDDEKPALAGSDLTQKELDVLQANFKRVQFDYDKSDLDEVSREVLAENAQILVEHPELVVLVEGHADHWGSDLYNLALGQTRADAVRRYLLDLGVLSTQMEVISFGEERPITAEGDRETEAPNRRAEFMVKVQSTAIEVGNSY